MEFELRPWRMEDVEAVAWYANNPKVAANLRDIFPYPYTRQDAEEFLQSCIHADPSRQCFRAIVIQGEAAGSISLSFGSDIARRSAELGLSLIHILHCNPQICCRFTHLQFTQRGAVRLKKQQPSIHIFFPPFL